MALLSLAGLLALALTLWFAIGAGAVGYQSGFEDEDGNLAPGDPIPNPGPPPSTLPGTFDWNSFSPTTWTGAAPYRTSNKTVSGWQFTGIEDAFKPQNKNDTQFAGGTKQDKNCPTVNPNTNVPNKDDLKRIYLSTKVVNGDTFLNLAWVRVLQNTTSASAHVGFEFNQGTTACGSGSPGLVNRMAGDMLIVYDFEGSATDTPHITLRRWVTSGPCEVSNSTAPCWGTATDLTALGFAEGKVNTSDVGSVSDTIGPSSPTSELLGNNEFGEAGINLTDAGVFQPGECVTFGKAQGVSRTSGNSGNAAMTDLAGPADFRLTNCGEIKIIKHTDPRGVDQNFSFTSTIPEAGSTQAPDEVCTADTTPAIFTLNDAAGVDNTANTEDCTNVPVGSYTVTEGADPAGFAFKSLACTASGTGTSVTPTSSTTIKTASITLAGGGLVTCTYTNLQQLGAIEILKTGKDKSQVTEEDPGPNFPLAGAKFSIKSGTTPISGSPFTTDENGRICVDGLAFGDYKVQETEPPAGYSADDTTEHTVTVDDNAKCDDTTYGGESIGFEDTPLTDLKITSTAQSAGANESGATESSIKCTDGAADAFPGTDIGNSPDPDTGTENPAEVDANGLEPGTYTCEVVVDP